MYKFNNFTPFILITHLTACVCRVVILYANGFQFVTVFEQTFADASVDYRNFGRHQCLVIINLQISGHAKLLYILYKSYKIRIKAYLLSQKNKLHRR